MLFRSNLPVFARKVCASIQAGESELGILVCGTGIGMAIAANKQKNIRAACCGDTFSAKMARLHNNANVLSLGSRILDTELAYKILSVFLETEFEGGRHQTRVDKLH